MKKTINVIFSCVFATIIMCSCEKHRNQIIKGNAENLNSIFLNKKKLIKYGNQDSTCTTFNFVNNTGQRLHIDTVKVKCHCTEVEYPHDVIENGNSGNIVVRIDIPDESAFFSQSVIVYFHGQKPIVLKVIGIKRAPDKDCL